MRRRRSLETPGTPPAWRATNWKRFSRTSSRSGWRSSNLEHASARVDETSSSGRLRIRSSRPPSGNTWSPERNGLRITRVMSGRSSTSVRVIGIGSAAGRPGSVALDSRFMSGSSEIVVDTLDIVLTEIVADLNLDEDKGFGAGVAYSVELAGADIDGVADSNVTGPAVEDNLVGPADDKPVLRTTGMTLVAEAFAGVNNDLFDLVPVGTAQHGVSAPGALIVFRSHPSPFLPSSHHLDYRLEGKRGVLPAVDRDAVDPHRFDRVVIATFVEFVAKEQDVADRQVERGHQLAHSIGLVDAGLGHVDRGGPSNMHLQIRETLLGIVAQRQLLHPVWVPGVLLLG